MKRFVISTLTILLTAAAVAPVARAVAVDDAADRNGDGVVSISEARLHFLDTHDSSQ
ncbi:MAG: hypothetical protein AAF152_04565 [Cyanobacteria bacterium P01_A01_bin.114]